MPRLIKYTMYQASQAMFPDLNHEKPRGSTANPRSRVCTRPRTSTDKDRLQDEMSMVVIQWVIMGVPHSTKYPSPENGCNAAGWASKPGNYDKERDAARMLEQVREGL